MSGAALLVIGRGSVLAREFILRNPDLPLRSVGHGEAGTASCHEGAACVVVTAGGGSTACTARVVGAAGCAAAACAAAGIVAALPVTAPLASAS